MPADAPRYLRLATEIKGCPLLHAAHVLAGGLIGLACVVGVHIAVRRFLR